MRTIPEEAQGSEDALDCGRARNESTLDTDGISSECKTCGSDAARRTLASAVRHQAVLRIRLLQKIVKREALERLDLLVRIKMRCGLHKQVRASIIGRPD